MDFINNNLINTIIKKYNVKISKSAKNTIIKNVLFEIEKNNITKQKEIELVLEKHIKAYLNILLEQDSKIVNDYIDDYVLVVDNKLEAISEINKIFNWFDSIEYIPSIDILSKIVINHKINQLLSKIIIENKISRNYIECITNNSSFESLIEMYCSLYSITIEETVCEYKDISKNEDVTNFKILMNEIKRYPLITPEEMEILLERIKQGDSEAKEKLICSNLRLVIYIAKKYLYRGLSIDDLFQEGSIGLIKSVEKYDYSKGFRFSTYASWWIKHDMLVALANQTRIIRLPVHMYEATQKVISTKNKFVEEYGREPTYEELNSLTNIPLSRIESVFTVPNTVSLNQPVSGSNNDSDTSELGDFIEAEKKEIEDFIEKVAAKKETEILLSKLSPKEEIVLRMRFGLITNNPAYEEYDSYFKFPHTLEEIGKIFNVTRERIRQIEANALCKLNRIVEGKPISKKRKP